jgi:hypothetical protein
MRTRHEELESNGNHLRKKSTRTVRPESRQLRFSFFSKKAFLRIAYSSGEDLSRQSASYRGQFESPVNPATGIIPTNAAVINLPFLGALPDAENAGGIFRTAKATQLDGSD